MKKCLKTSLLLLLVACLLLPLTSCNREKYPMRASSSEQSRTVFALGEDPVPMEVLFTFYMSQKSLSAENGENVSHEELLKRAAEAMAELYATLAVCRKYGIDPFSEEMNEKVKEKVVLSVEGGVYGSDLIAGEDSYDAYLRKLETDFYMTDAVSRFIIRCALAEEELYYSFGRLHDYEREDVEAFFASEDCIRLNWIRRVNEPDLTSEDLRTILEHAREALATASTYEEVRNIIIQHGPLTVDPKTENGFYIGRYTWDPRTHAPLIEAAYALAPYEYSEVIDLESDGMYVLYKMEKHQTDLSDRYEEIAEMYLGDAMYGEISRLAAELVAGLDSDVLTASRFPESLFNEKTFFASEEQSE